ncbi:winged helix-turn-helix domain-containing protein [Providencia stuartii]|uniref:winged helix-turn-helix domain-containing protein n=1 Tax=Providencia stuartii TaxID=588 RepID=UPI0033288741
MKNSKEYLINNKFIFEIGKNFIFIKNEVDKFVELSKPASRLLNEIIILNQKSKIATREELLIKVWEEYGLVGSNNNLNTYISEIRKKFELIGIDPKSIVTVPKKGFRFDCDALETITDENDTPYLPEEEIVVLNSSDVTLGLDDYEHSVTHSSQYSEKNAEEATTQFVDQKSIIEEHLHQPRQDNSISELSSTVQEEPQLLKIQNKGKFKNNPILFALIAMSLFLFIFVFYYTTNSNASMEVNSYMTVSERDKCLIQIPINLIESSTKDSIDFVNKKLDKYNVNCQEPKRVILLSEPNSIQSVDKNISLSICKEKKAQYDCVSINDQRI